MIIWNKERFSYSFIMKWFKERKMKKKIYILLYLCYGIYKWYVCDKMGLY